MLTRFATNILKGTGLGLGVATGLTGWGVLLRYSAGTAPFEHLHTGFPDVVRGYYLGGLCGGLLVGLAWPLRRWVLGYAVLSILGVFPLYFFAKGEWPAGPAAVSEKVATSLLGALFVGPAVGIWAWTDDHPERPGWLDALRHPSATVLARVWALVVIIVGLSWYLIPLWSNRWPFTAVILAAGVLFVAPLSVALLVTRAFFRGRALTG